MCVARAWHGDDCGCAGWLFRVPFANSLSMQCINTSYGSRRVAVPLV